mgnify:FL=1
MKKLPLKLKAVGILVGLVICSILGIGLANIAVETYGIQTVGNVCVACFLAYMLYLVYGVILARLEYDEKFKNLSKKD